MLPDSRQLLALPSVHTSFLVTQHLVQLKNVAMPMLTDRQLLPLQDPDKFSDVAVKKKIEVYNMIFAQVSGSSQPGALMCTKPSIFFRSYIWTNNRM